MRAKLSKNHREFDIYIYILKTINICYYICNITYYFSNNR